MKFARIPSIAVSILIAILPRNSQAQTIIDPSRTSQSIRPDVTAQPLLRDQSALNPNSLTQENGFAPPSPGDSDIGPQVLLKKPENYQPFSISLDSSGYFTDNAANTSAGAQHDWFYVGGVVAGYQPRLTNRLYGDVNLAQHWFRYDQFRALDYEDGDVSAGVILLMPELWNTLWHVHYDYERITQGLDTPIYQSHSLRTGVQKTALINRSHSLNFSLLASFAMDTTPVTLRRHEYSGLVAWNYKMTSSFLFTLSYRLAYYDYFKFDGREDWYHNFGAALAWHPRKWCELVASYSYTLNRSNHDAFSYDTQITGPSLSLRAKF